MRLTLHTDYALRVLVHAGLKGGELVTINEIAEAYDISKNHLTKVVHELGRSGYLETVRGKYGGMRLLRQPEDIKLGEFIRSTEEDFALARCMRENGEECCRLASDCVAKKAMTEAMVAFFEVLDRYTLADMLAVEKDIPFGPLTPLLGGNA